MISQELQVRKVNQGDHFQLNQLLQKESFIHQHLGWQPPLAWLGKQPYLALESGGELISALACPPDEDQVTWIRLFAVAPGFSIFRAWNTLWPVGLRFLENETGAQSVNCLVVRDRLIDLLLKSGFKEEYQVVALLWSITGAKWPASLPELTIRDMIPEDFPRIYEIDQAAFETIWRNTVEQLKIAYSDAISARVVEVDGVVVGYQISTRTAHSGHLARLAVDPDYQKKKVASALVADVLDQFQRQGIIQVTVNTQLINQASLNLYKKFGFQQMEEVYPVFQYCISQGF